MFLDKKNKKPHNISAEHAVNQNRINEGTSIIGDIESTGFFRVDGIIKGNISAPSKVVLGKKGIIIGTLTCEHADIEGTFEGILTVSNLLTLRSSAKIDGDVFVGKLAVEQGAEINATSKMGNGVKTLSNDGESRKEGRIA